MGTLYENVEDFPSTGNLGKKKNPVFTASA
jgi:hypothetical protein